MNNQDVMAMLEAAVEAAAAGRAQATEETQIEVQHYQASLSAEVKQLLQEAVAMRWPFVPEKWQYKDSISSEDKTNLKELITQHLPHLLAFLRCCIRAGDSQNALSVLFLVDRFLYWTDASRALLRIVKTLHKHYPDTPIAPQLIIRQARLSVNSGNLQKAEFILSSLINNSGKTGSWVYHTDTDRALVQAVSVQVRGQVLQKLGLWREAAELMCASLAGFFALPQPDKKGIGASLGLLASILMSMNDKDFHAFMNCPYLDLRFLKEREHRLLLAGEAAKMAMVYSQYTSLYILSGGVIQGTCLLSYSLSQSCPDAKREEFLTQSKHAFEIGLLTRSEDEAVPSRQELHMFVKAAHSLVITHKWLGSSSITVRQAGCLCQEAMEKLYTYSLANSLDKDKLGKEIMRLVGQVKTLFNVQPFENSDECSFIPDSYKSMEEVHVRFSLPSFFKAVEMFSQYHTTVCEAFAISCKRTRSRCEESPGVCITALRTTTETPDTECNYEGQAPFKKPKVPLQNNEEKQTCQHGIMEQHIVMQKTSGSSASSKMCLQPSSKGACSPHLEASAHQGFTLATDNSIALTDAQCPTEDGEEEWQNICNQPLISGPHMNRYREKQRSSSSSLSDSFSSLSSWQKISLTDSSSSFSTQDSSGKDNDLSAKKMDRMVNVVSAEVSRKGRMSSSSSSDSTQSHSHPGLMAKVQSRNDRKDGSSSSSNLGSMSSWQTFRDKREGCPDIHQDISSGTREELEWLVDIHCPTEASEETEDVFQHSSVRANNMQPSTGDGERNRLSFSDSLGSLSSWKKVSLSDSGSSLDNFGRGENKVVAQTASGSDEWVDMSCFTEFSEDDAHNDWPGNSTEHEPMRKKQSVISLCPQSSSQALPNEYERSNSWSLLLNMGKSNTNDPVTDHVDDFANSRSSVGVRKPLKHHLTCAETSLSTVGSFEVVEDDNIHENIENAFGNEKRSIMNDDQSQVRCPQQCLMGGEILEEHCTLTEQDYKSFMSGMCHKCLLQRLSNTGIFKLRKFNHVYSALLLKYSKAAGLWTSQETMVYVGDSIGKQGMQRIAFWVQCLHQEELLGSYVGKDYLSEKELHYHLNDVERQMTAQNYVTEFNKRLYEKKIAMQIFFIPSEVLLILEDSVIVGCITVEPYMQGDFVKLTNNTTKVVRDYKASDYGIAFGHFTFHFSGGTEVVVDLQGWVTANGKGLTYLTDPQIHSLHTPGSRTNFGRRGIKNFLESQHGPECNDICRRLGLQSLGIPGKTEGATAQDMNL